MDDNDIIHILRNPSGWTEDTLRAVRLRAADYIEWLQSIVNCCAAECPPDDSLEVNERVAVLAAENRTLRKKLSTIVAIVNKFGENQKEVHDKAMAEAQVKWEYITAEAERLSLL